MSNGAIGAAIKLVPLPSGFLNKGNLDLLDNLCILLRSRKTGR